MACVLSAALLLPSPSPLLSVSVCVGLWVGGLGEAEAEEAGAEVGAAGAATAVFVGSAAWYMMYVLLWGCGGGKGRRQEVTAAAEKQRAEPASPRPSHNTSIIVT